MVTGLLAANQKNDSNENDVEEGVIDLRDQIFHTKLAKWHHMQEVEPPYFLGAPSDKNSNG